MKAWPGACLSHANQPTPMPPGPPLSNSHRPSQDSCPPEINPVLGARQRDSPHGADLPPYSTWPVLHCWPALPHLSHRNSHRSSGRGFSLPPASASDWTLQLSPWSFVVWRGSVIPKSLSVSLVGSGLDKLNPGFDFRTPLSTNTLGEW